MTTLTIHHRHRDIIVLCGRQIPTPRPILIIAAVALLIKRSKQSLPLECLVGGISLGVLHDDIWATVSLQFLYTFLGLYQKSALFFNSCSQPLVVDPDFVDCLLHLVLPHCKIFIIELHHLQVFFDQGNIFLHIVWLNIVQKNDDLLVYFCHVEVLGVGLALHLVMVVPAIIVCHKNFLVNFILLAKVLPG